MTEASSSRKGDRDHRLTDRSGEHDARKSRRRSRSPSVDAVGPHPPHAVLTKLGVPELTAEDYYARAGEFKTWLAGRGAYLDEISGHEARRLFDKFVRRWNSGRLAEGVYAGERGAQTRHKWAFRGRTAEEERQTALVRDSVDTLTNSATRGAAEQRKRPKRDDEVGGGEGSRGSTDAALRTAALQDQRQRARADERDTDEAWHGKATGRDRLLEKKRERNSANRAFATRRETDDGIEMDDRDLFDDMPAAPQRATPGTNRREQRAADRKAELQDKVSTLKTKEAQTRDMFKALAQQRFGP